MLTLTGLSYIHTNRDLLFQNIDLAVNPHDKVALIGNNGAGKSTLLKIMAGELSPAGGNVWSGAKPYYVPQHTGQFNDLTIAQALRIDEKLMALKSIVNGNVTDENLSLVGDDWLLEERCREAMHLWDAGDLTVERKMGSLSGGQKTKIFLAGITIHQPEIILLDEPSNHLDLRARNSLYDFIRNTSSTLIAVSHDKTLLNLLDTVFELGKQGINVYGGNYNFYAEQKRIESDALHQDLHSKEKEFRKAKEVERESVERKQKLDARGKKKQEKSGLPTILMNTLRNKAEKSTSRLKDVHAGKIGDISKALNTLRATLPATDKMKLNLNNSSLHWGKRLIEATEINFTFTAQPLWKNPLSFLITSGERIAIRGDNGSGKTTLVNIMLGSLHPTTGAIERAPIRQIHIDQDYSLIDAHVTVYEQSQQYNDEHLPEHEVKIRLNRFLFTKDHWDKSCSSLSGGEKMRLILCCLMISNQSPDVIVLDEPTNNLDIQNTEILTAAINGYRGTLIVISHDQHFLKEVNIEKTITIV